MSNFRKAIMFDQGCVRQGQVYDVLNISDPEIDKLSDDYRCLDFEQAMRILKANSRRVDSNGVFNRRLAINALVALATW